MGSVSERIDVFCTEDPELLVFVMYDPYDGEQIQHAVGVDKLRELYGLLGDWLSNRSEGDD